MCTCQGGSGVDGAALKRALARAVVHFSRHVERINEMNVFPVPDGDTGINMYHTLQRAYNEVADIENASVAEVSQRFAYGALMGARGNSGTIFSQLMKGFAEELQRAEILTTPAFVLACMQAVQYAYAAVTSPVEGTILTVAREATETLQLRAKDDLSLSKTLDILVSAADESLWRTPDSLPILKEAGVVDAGALGLLTFLEGLASNNRNDNAPMHTELPLESSRHVALDVSSDTAYGYDVQFLMLGKDLNIAKIRRDLGQMGWSLLVVGDEFAVKVHIHVDNPSLPIDYAIQSGARLDDIVVENMELQFQRRWKQESMPVAQPEQRARNDIGVIAVAPGPGLWAVFEELGCDAVISGGQGANPSVEDFLEIIDGMDASSVIILPNNRNIIMTARQSAELADAKRIVVVPAPSVVQGISAMIALRSVEDGGGNLESAIRDMRAAAEQVCSIEIAPASHDSHLHDMEIRRGDYIAVVDGQISVASATIEACVLDAFDTVVNAGHELATLYYGNSVREEEAAGLIERLSIDFSELEFDLVFGGQDLYPYLIGLE